MAQKPGAGCGGEGTDTISRAPATGPGHPTDYRRVLSRTPWSGLARGRALTRFVFDRLVPDGPVMVVGDDTANGHEGPHVCGKARHRDAVRSSHAYTAFRYGHTWVVLAVLVKFPFTTARGPGRYRSEGDDQKRNRPHRTPPRIMCGLLRLLLLRFPDRTFVFAGDSGYGTHEVARMLRWSKWVPCGGLSSRPARA